jgi:hypothetical protein
VVKLTQNREVSPLGDREREEKEIEKEKENEIV